MQKVQFGEICKARHLHLLYRGHQWPGQIVISTREGGVSRSAASSQRKSSGSATRHESELRLRKLLQHSNEKLDRSEQARTEFEGRLKLLQDVLNHRDSDDSTYGTIFQSPFSRISDMSTPNWEYTRASLSNASAMLNEQFSSTCRGSSYG